MLPASHRLQLGNLKAQLGESVDLATEHELDQLFRDCAPGAVPALGECYGLDVIVEDSIRDQPEVYLEGGDHATVVRMSQSEYARLTTEALHGRFGAHA